jgi:hypothetical protein
LQIPARIGGMHLGHLQFALSFVIARLDRAIQ